ncbi:MAG: type II toxin-antitoxin system PemK/MazF family toxin, partial [Bacteroidota bacterium]
MKLGEVWQINFAPQIGDQIRKIRPAAIVNHDSMGALQLKVVVPITDAFRNVREWHVLLEPSLTNGLSKSSVADCFQIKSISKTRFIEKIGDLNQNEMDQVKLGL